MMGIYAACFTLMFGLFSTGAGGRHDWMRFHADQVPCPRTIKGIECHGSLKWRDGNKDVVICDACSSHFAVKYIGRPIKK